MVKSALVFAVKNGVDKKSCVIPLQYLKNNSTESFFQFYYEKDVVLNRPLDRIFHCVAVHSSNNILLAYVEYFSVFRLIICLSDTYLGKPIHNSHFIDPVLGKEFIQEFEMPITDRELIALYKSENSFEDGMEKSIDCFMQFVKRNNLKALIDLGTKDAMDYAFKNCGATENEMPTSEQTRKFMALFFSKMTPFVKQHNITGFFEAFGLVAPS